MSPLERMAVDLVPCDYCKARPKNRCRRASGKVAAETHAVRRRPIYAAFGLGYTDALAHERGTA